MKRHSAYDVPCLKCGAPRGQPCRGEPRTKDVAKGRTIGFPIPDVHWARKRAHQMHLERKAASP